MTELIIIFSFLTTLISLIIVRPVAVKLSLVDFPNERKNHVGNIPLIGGICIFLGILIPYFFFIDFDIFSNTLLITASLILIHGVWDDLANLNAKTKMAYQISLTAIMIYITDVKIENLGYLFDISYPLELGILSIPITVIAVVGLTNAINMIDGLDGFAASFSLLAIIGLLCFNIGSEVSSLTNILLAIASALLPFMIFNIAPYPKIKVFLGDGGSLFLGYVISWALIYNAENINSFTPSFALWCVAIPLFDFFSVIILRIIEKRSLMIANKDHIHHFLEDVGFSKKLILVITVSFGLAVLLVGNFMENNIPVISLPVFLMLFLLYLFVRIYNRSNKKVKRH